MPAATPTYRRPTALPDTRFRPAHLLAGRGDRPHRCHAAVAQCRLLAMGRARPEFVQRVASGRLLLPRRPPYAAGSRVTRSSGEANECVLWLHWPIPAPALYQVYVPLKVTGSSVELSYVGPGNTITWVRPTNGS